MMSFLASLAVVSSGCTSPTIDPGWSRWIDQALLRQAPPGEPTPAIVVLQHTNGSLQIDRSVRNTPLQIGARKFAHGLGTHSLSELLVRLPEDAVRFQAFVGIDNNWDTAAVRGSVRFAVESGGKSLFQSGVRKGSDEPLEVDVELPRVRTLNLKVDDAGDGVAYDQCDWAEPVVTLASGKKLSLEKLPIESETRFGEGLPIEMKVGGKSLSELIGSWSIDVSEARTTDGRTARAVRATDPASGLAIRCETTQYDGFPAVEWVVRIKNEGSADSPMIESIQPLALDCFPAHGEEVVLRYSKGSATAADDFLPQITSLATDKEILLHPNGGRSSSGTLPFFNLSLGDDGLVGAIGWSGQWELSVRRSSEGRVRLQAGQATTHLVLRPGEEIRTPRILLVRWKGDEPLAGNQILRKLLVKHYLPRLDGELAMPPIAQVDAPGIDLNAVNEANQLAAIARLAKRPIETYWLDAGWFEGLWPSGVGSWDPRKDAFPKGLKPLGDAAHKNGMKFLLWFEPERVYGTSRIGKEHPEFLLKTPAVEAAWPNANALFNLGEPVARKWLADYLIERFEAWGVDVFRCDFNFDPLPYWQAADTADRVGMAEIRYVEGLYALWDDLRARKPGLTIDNCASGGRRIDLETISRSYALWRSDTQCTPRAMPTWDQTQTAGLSLYVPFHTAGIWSFDPYEARSVMTVGTVFQPDVPGQAPLSEEGYRRLAKEIKRLRPLWLGEFWPLGTVSLEESHWAGWQCHRDDLNEGFVMLFRRPGSPYSTMEAVLRGIDPKAAYVLEDMDTGRSRRIKGAQLSALQVTIAKRPGSALLVYKKAP